LAPIDRRDQLGGQAGGLGLTCTPEGVFLAGVPLLRSTITGLAPRPMAELAALMTSAYGHDIGPNRPYPGLEVIAKALNQGDIGRAMIAAIQLRLPELDEEGAANIDRVDEALKKYDPNEPRDERGRWTSGGGSPSIHAPNPVAREQSGAPAKSPASHRPSRPTKPTAVAPNLRSAAMKPILVSDSGGHIGGVPIASLMVSMALTDQCTRNAHEPRYYDKTQLCAAVFRTCNWLLEVNKEEPLRRDSCVWPDGSAAMMKFGILVPFKVGHKF
jgi:hypothetical protein